MATTTIILILGGVVGAAILIGFFLRHTLPKRKNLTKNQIDLIYASLAIISLLALLGIMIVTIVG